MISVSVKQLVSAIEEAKAFEMPDMNAGTRYIYDELYGKLSGGKGLRLSEIDFARFETEDINSMRDLYDNVLEANEYGAEKLVRSLCVMAPSAVPSVFI